MISHVVTRDSHCTPASSGGQSGLASRLQMIMLALLVEIAQRRSIKLRHGRITNMQAPSAATSPSTNQKSGMTNFARTKRCTTCLERWPLSEFRKEPRCRGGRQTQCRQCHNLRERTRAATARRLEQAKYLQHQLKAIQSVKSQRRILALVDDTVAAFGGPEQLATEFRSMFDESSDCGDLRTASRILLAIAAIVEHTSSIQAADTGAVHSQASGGAILQDAKAVRPAEPDFDQMTDKQLAARYRKLKRGA